MSIASIRRLTNAGLLGLGVAALGACSAEGPSAPTLEKPSLGYIPSPTQTPPGVLSANSTIVPEMIKVCKAYSGTPGPAVQIRVQVDSANNGPGSGDEDFIVTVANGECWEVWSTDSNANVITDNVTFTETVPNGYTASYVLQTRENGAIITNAPVASNTGSVLVTNPGNPTLGIFDGVVWTFTNTEIVDEGCTFTQGYWKNHTGLGPQADAWPALPGGVMALGTVNYTKAQLISIFNTAPKGNGLISLARQLIAANLNILNGASATDISATIAAANTLIGALVVPPVGSGFLAPSATSALTQALEQFNEGATGPGHCDELEPTDD